MKCVLAFFVKIAHIHFYTSKSNFDVVHSEWGRTATISVKTISRTIRYIWTINDTHYYFRWNSWRCPLSWIYW